MGKRTAEETGLPNSNGRITVDRSNSEWQFQVTTWIADVGPHFSLFWESRLDRGAVYQILRFVSGEHIMLISD